MHQDLSRQLGGEPCLSLYPPGQWEKKLREVETMRRGAAGVGNKTVRAYLRVLRGSAARLVDDLLSLSRIELNEHTPPTDRIDVARILGEVVESLGFGARSRGMTITLDCAAGLPAIAGDRKDLAQVFENLIDNAVKYGAADSAIGITAKVVTKEIPPSLPAVAECIAVAISDRGEGIPLEHQPRLTERFYRVDTARSRELGGTGLGLAIVKHVVNRHRGTLTIASTPGEGSTFTVYLPTRPSTEDETAAGAAAASAGA